MSGAGSRALNSLLRLRKKKGVGVFVVHSSNGVGLYIEIISLDLSREEGGCVCRCRRRRRRAFVNIREGVRDRGFGERGGQGPSLSLRKFGEDTGLERLSTSLHVPIFLHSKKKLFSISFSILVCPVLWSFILKLTVDRCVPIFFF